MATDKHQEVEKSVDEAKSVAASLAALSFEQLTSINHLVNDELEKRAKKSSKKKNPAEMSDKEFEALKARLFLKAKGKDSDDGDE